MPTSSYVHHGRAVLHMLATSGTGPTVTPNQFGGSTAISGYVVPVTENLSLTHNGEVEHGMQYGDVLALHGGGEYLECQFTFIPTDSTTDISDGNPSAASSYANAAKAATIPPLLSTMDVSGLPIVAAGPFANALNTNGDDDQPWFYVGGAQLGGDHTQWTLTATFRRYYHIGTHADPA